MSHFVWAPLLALSIQGGTAVDFDTDVLPILTKAGCNAAACHGSAAGRGGFRLSLFGGDPAADYDSIVRRRQGRRINLAHPDDSLLLAKPTGMLDHGGDVRLEYDGRDAELIARWIREGAERAKARRLVRLIVNPPRATVAKVPETIRLRIVAVFDDESRREVTHRAVVRAADPVAIDVDSEQPGRLTVRRSGRHTIVLRYLSAVQTVQVTAPLPVAPLDLSTQPRANPLDEHILAALQTLRIPPSPLADDATQLRRLTLDLTGRLPTPDEALAYLKDPDPQKYDRRVEQLLASPEFVEFWTYQLAKLLRVRAQPAEQAGAIAFHGWIAEQLTADRPWNEMATELLTATGDSHQYGPANFYRSTKGPRQQAEYVSELLMGVRLRCANCHNHPLDQWTQDDYHGLAAVFAGIDRGRVVKLIPGGEVTHPRTGKAAEPRIPGSRFLKSDDDGRKDLAAWLARADNPYFAKALVNRVWKALMGRGLVEPTDDLRATNPATHPELLDELAADFIQHGYRLRHTLRRIALTNAYRRSSVPIAGNRSDDRFYSHALTRPLAAEVLADALADVTGVPDAYPDLPRGTRAVQLVDPETPSVSLDILGRCNRETGCESPAGQAGGGLSTRLHLINGPLINAKITHRNSRVQQLLKAGKTNAEILRAFYLGALGRHPRDKERTFWLGQLAEVEDDGERVELLEDFLWSLLSCREFTNNH